MFTSPHPKPPSVLSDNTLSNAAVDNKLVVLRGGEIGLDSTTSATLNSSLQLNGTIHIGTSSTYSRLGVFGATAVAKQTTSATPATYASVGGSAVSSLDTFGGYTVGQVVTALKNYGLLA